MSADPSSAPGAAPRLAVLCDLLEEGWPSMDLAAERLVAELERSSALRVAAVRPPFRRRLTRLSSARVFVNGDRLLNRRWDYPRVARGLADANELFHVADHSYAHLVHDLPAGRTGVYCHDLDAFRCLLEPAAEPRPAWFRAMAQKTASGLARAAVVFHSTAVVGEELAARGLVDRTRLVLAPYGVAPELTAEGPGAAPSMTCCTIEVPYLLHVGSTIPRKRVDVLLDVLAAVRARVPGVRLVQVGGAWTDEQRSRIERLGLAPAIVQLRGLDRATLATIYRSAAAVLLTSEREGFGLPAIEGLACGAVVVTSDIPALREVGGDAALRCPVGDVAAWTETVVRVLSEPKAAPPRAARLERASRFTWADHARRIEAAYLAVARGGH
jgi:glycosyltransferase involved in cell wall biosynthesis